MKICDKHLAFFEVLYDPEDEILAVSKFHETLNVIEDQGHIEARKNKCQVCYYGALGRKTLVKILKSFPQKKIKVTV